MSDSYVDAKIHEALQATNGDKKDATKLLVTWAVRDQALLLGIAKPDLKELAQTRVEEVLRKLKKTDVDKALASKEKEAILLGQIKGEKRNPVKVPPPKSSERQASVMHQLAAAFRKKS